MSDALVACCSGADEIGVESGGILVDWRLRLPIVDVLLITGEAADETDVFCECDCVWV